MKAKIPKRVTFHAKVFRADGTVDDYGVVQSTEWGPIRRWFAKRRIEKLNRERGVG